MKIVKLRLKKYRNYDNLDIELNDKLNVIIGNNAQGKTNILEAIYFLSLTKSFLQVDEKNCIKKGSLFAKIDAKLKTNSHLKKLEISKLIINNQKKYIHHRT